ncbi:NipSnap3A [Thecamonas trahens ATCC 50062]|uniref:NipSnap3A n=1 Tax=Thecamonas trahens ATCC 50062 TaxID=461836 RepID=A0A0L0DEF6_THETB|nr:NipSnap3A [Thecamonas trahens ATCC 50062]KNC50541.1 NipSnap3A [Thecamonas trahens ATCC 50062]|eukprot:XP_013762433.1 NipSnap3A [Thecamonas trahens ATCC 50062]
MAAVAGMRTVATTVGKAATGKVAAADKAVPEVYELRTYAIQPAHFPAFMKLTGEKIGLRTAVSPLLMYGATEIGGANEVVHLWKYPSLAERQGVRVALAGAAEWNADYMDVMRPMLAGQTNLTLSPPGWAGPTAEPVAGEPAGAVYELRIRSLQCGMADAWSELLREALPSHPAGDALWANLMATVGPHGESAAVEIWRFDSFEARDDVLACLGQPGVMPPSDEATAWHNAMEDSFLYVEHEATKLILPAPFSPSQ